MNMHLCELIIVIMGTKLECFYEDIGNYILNKHIYLENII